MVKATIFDNKEDSKDALKRMQHMLDKRGIDYTVCDCNPTLVSENYNPVVVIDGRTYDNERSLFMYLHREYPINEEKK